MQPTKHAQPDWTTKLYDVVSRVDDAIVVVDHKLALKLHKAHLHKLADLIDLPQPTR